MSVSSTNGGSVEQQTTQPVRCVDCAGLVDELFTHGLVRVCESCLADRLADEEFADFAGERDEAEPEATNQHDDAPVVRFVSPDELRATVPPEPPWLWHGYLAAGALTVLAGKPKAGKSTLGFAIAQAIGGQAPEFLGHAVQSGPVVYVSEEGAATLAHKVSGDALRIATRDTAWPRPDWPSLIAGAVAEAERTGAAVLIVDTFAFWAALGPESEKDAGAVQSAMEPLVAVARGGLGVLLVVHARKGGGEDGEGVRGSSALAGAADIVLELERIDADSPRQRKLLALSRYPQTPGALVFEHDRSVGGWSVIGEGTDRGDARDIASRAALVDTLSYDEDTSRKELEEQIGSPHRQWGGTLDQLVEDGVIARSGEGKKGDPYRYRKLRNGAAQNPRRNGGAADSDAAAPRRGQHQNHDAASFGDSCPCAESDDGLAARAEEIAERYGLNGDGADQ